VTGQPSSSERVFWRNLLTTLECIVREPVLSVEVGLDAEESPATAGVRCVEVAAAAMGSENNDTKRDEEARRRVEANVLAAGAVVACGAGGARCSGFYSARVFCRTPDEKEDAR
jgi:hypothetical protein